MSRYFAIVIWSDIIFLLKQLQRNIHLATWSRNGRKMKKSATIIFGYFTIANYVCGCLFEGINCFENYLVVISLSYPTADEYFAQSSAKLKTLIVVCNVQHLFNVWKNVFFHWHFQVNSSVQAKVQLARGKHIFDRPISRVFSYFADGSLAGWKSEHRWSHVELKFISTARITEYTKASAFPGMFLWLMSWNWKSVCSSLRVI